MKHDWEYKKLGDVCTIERGGSPRPISAYITDAPDGINWIKIGDAVEGSKYISTTKEKIRVEGMKKSRLVHKGDFILSNSMSFGKPYILGVDGCIHDGWLVIHDDYNTFNKDYLYYYLSSPSMYRKFESLAVGGVVNNLNSQLVRNVIVAIPPMEEQEEICSLLDKLSLVIEKKKEQVQQLDNLAQSIFYDMFGDPVENEKGWELKSIDSVCKAIVRGPFGSALKKEFFVPQSNDTYKVYEQKHAINKDISIGEYFITNEKFKELRRFEVFPLDIIMSCSGTIGELFQIPIDAPKGVMNQALLKFTLNNTILPSMFIRIMGAVKENMVVHGCGLQNIGSVKEIKQTTFGLPPISLQQSFAQKVEAIERQKELINQSIAEVQTLFDSQMDKYFG
jgi:type I restriction enzyme S subunit